VTPRKRRWLTAATAVVVAVGLPVIVNRVSVQPGAALVKMAFEAGPGVTAPPNYATLAAGVSVTKDLTVPTADAPDAHLDVYTPKQHAARPLPMILWIHGGGFISGTKDQVADYATMLAGNGYTVASLDYSLAPGSEHPVPVRQANAALRYLGEHAGTYQGDNTTMFVGGDSAGSQIASQTAAVETNPALAAQMHLTPGVGPKTLRGALLFCGLYDMKTVGDTGFPALQTFMWAYTGRRDWQNYPDLQQLSTTAQVTNAYPATLLTVGDNDPFEGQGRELVTALQHDNVPVKAQFYSGAKLGHEYQFNFALPQANQMFATTLTFLTDHSTKGATS
jgi:acetyl esterase/lipase